MEEYKDYSIKTIRTCAKHYFVESENQDKNSNLLSVNCNNCPTGANIDSNKFKVINGEICAI